jgi:hypothetical protein
MVTNVNVDCGREPEDDLGNRALLKARLSTHNVITTRQTGILDALLKIVSVKQQHCDKTFASTQE